VSKELDSSQGDLYFGVCTCLALTPFEGGQPGGKVQVQRGLAALKWKKVFLILFAAASGSHAVEGHTGH
jgi:hypothetical protein